ncbi:hypothetical protein R3P38DRAFT_3219061 [Favolaschia claudopus]|uniref:Uncharacterized protein n=1 Tax=Favolaschia claudopus TaxID=2862362 RepID=A0AAW0A3G8_9AGAR
MAPRPLMALLNSVTIPLLLAGLLHWGFFGALTVQLSVATLVTIGLYYGSPDTLYYFVSAQLIPNLYANTILAVLNSRLQIVGGRSSDPSATEFISLPEFARSSGTNTTDRSLAPVQRKDVQ